MKTYKCDFKRTEGSLKNCLDYLSDPSNKYELRPHIKYNDVYLVSYSRNFRLSIVTTWGKISIDFDRIIKKEIIQNYTTYYLESVYSELYCYKVGTNKW